MQAPIEEPELAGGTTTEDRSMPDCEMTSVARRKARRNKLAQRVATTPRETYRLPGGYALGSVVCLETEVADGTVRKGELGIVVHEPTSAAETGCGQRNGTVLR